MEKDSLEAEMGSRKRRDVEMSDYFDFVSESDQDAEEAEYDPLPTDEPSEQESDEKFDRDNEADIEGRQPSYDSKKDLPDFDAVGSYTLDLVGQRRVLQRERRETMNHLELPEATESTLMAHIDHSQSDW